MQGVAWAIADSVQLTTAPPSVTVFVSRLLKQKLLHLIPLILVCLTDMCYISQDYLSNISAVAAAVRT